MGTVAEIIALAKTQLGVKEYPPGSNIVKYNDWFWGWGNYPSNYGWCLAFIQWLLKNSGTKNEYMVASCIMMRSWAINNGKFVENSQIMPGDIAFFTWNNDPANPDHVGLVTDVSDIGVYTIEGNTSITSNDNGGCVMERFRRFTVTCGAYRPPYDRTVEEVFMITIDEWNKLQAELAKKDGSKWSATERKKIEELGIIKDGNWKAVPTREELAVVIYRVLKLLGAV